jgi:hypothetical protein
MNRTLQRAAAGLAFALLAGCAQMSHVTTGESVIKDRLMVTVERGWNQFARGLGDNVPTWTQEGVTVDTLRFYVALKDGELIAPTPSEVVALFEGLYSRGGSTFTLDKVEPGNFLGGPGFRFEFSSIRKSDDVRLRGVAWGAVRNGELWVITYTAPRLAFFPRGVTAAENIARSARVKG